MSTAQLEPIVSERSDSPVYAPGSRSVPRAIPAAVPERAVNDSVIEAKSVSVFYGQHQAINNVSLTVPRHGVVAFIGPSGCGKSTFLRSINRLNDLIPGCRITGDLTVDGQNIYDPYTDLVDLRRRVGLVFQKPNPFPKSIFENV